MKTTPAQYAEVQKLCVELPLLEERLHRAGLHVTAQKLNQAVKDIGFEAANMLTALERGHSPEKARKIVAYEMTGREKRHGRR